MNIVCACGQKIDTTVVNMYQVVERDEQGNIIYAVCCHGNVVVDSREKDILNKIKDLITELGDEKLGKKLEDILNDKK